jgi:hypothetical protein
MYDFLQAALNVNRIVANQSASNYCFLPGVLMAHFRNRDVKLTVQARQEWFQAAALFFEGSTARYVQMEF